MKKTSTNYGNSFKKSLVTILAIFSLALSQSIYAHSVDSYSANCGSGPQYIVTATVSNVNSTSNYRWQWLNASNAWVCFVNGTNIINALSYNISGAVYNLTTTPGPIIFTNPSSGLQGLQMRMVISDGNGIDPCTLPSGNTWTSTNPHVININNTACGSYACPALQHNPFTNFNSSSNTGAATSLWLSIKTKLTATDLPNNGDFLLFGSGTLSLNGITSNPAITNAAIPVGKIIADNTVSSPSTTYDGATSTWITKVPPGYSSAAIFITAGIFNSSNGFVAGSGKNSVVNGIFYSNRPQFSSSWYYGLACYQPQFTYASVAGVNQVTPVNGTYQPGTPTTQLSYLVAGGSGGGGSNYTGSNSSTDGYTTCLSPNSMQLGNRVWYDTDNDGINDATENGIRNVTVYLYKDDNNDNVADGASLATAVTDVNGNYLFSNLAPGNYIIGVITPNGYISSAVNGGDPDNNTDLDDNGQVVVGTEIRGLAITLTEGGEPTGGNTNNTYDFGFLPDCSCATSSSNLLINGSFENGTTGWSWSSGSLTTGTGYIACGAKNGFNNWSSGTSKVWQDVNMAPGVTVTFSGFAGTTTTGITCSPILSLIFLNAANTVLGQSNVTVTRNVNINNSQLEQYSIIAVAPAGTTKVRIQSTITCNTMQIDAFCLTSDNVGCTTCALGYPDNSNLPKSAVVFNENEVLRAMEPSSTTCGILNSGFIKLWYSDEHALLLGVDSVVVKRPNGSFYSTKYPITTYGGTPTCASNLLFGTTINTGAQSGNDVAAGGGRPIRPVLFLTDLTVNGNTSRVGDWQQGGAPYNPTTVCGNWKSGYKFVDSSRNPVVVEVNPYGDPAPNISGTTWNLGGGEQPPAGTTNQSYGALVKWDINSLGLIPGHSYRIQVMVHDGDQNKEGGDAGSMCTTIYVPIVLTSSIGDRVWEDDNRNGLQDAGELGIGGVIVTLSGTASGTTTTAADGSYHFNNLAAGTYNVTFTTPTAPGNTFLPTTPNVGSNDAIDSDPVNGVVSNIVLTVGQVNNTIDAGFYRLININGHVWNDANGLTDLQINKTGIAAIPNSLNIYLVDVATNLIVQAESINFDGTYSFLDVDVNHSYKIVLSTVVAFPGQTSPIPFLPSGWQRVGENLGAGPLSGSDGVPNGILFLDTETSDVFDANFGIRVSGGEIIVG